MRELALHVLDVAQNSLEADATRIKIAIHEDLEADRLTIQVADNGRGMEPELLERVLDPFVTTRTTRRLGMGLPLLAAAAERCDGELDIQSRVGQGTEVTAIFQHSHIDRAPLGDMQGTLMALILANPKIRLDYFHQLGQQRFAFSTTEIRKELGDVPLTYGPVIQWLREYLEENLAALRDAARPIS